MDNYDLADKKLAVEQTATMFRALVDPTIKFNTGWISLAVGLEEELISELTHRGVEIKVTAALQCLAESAKYIAAINSLTNK